MANNHKMWLCEEILKPPPTSNFSIFWLQRQGLTSKIYSEMIPQFVTLELGSIEVTEEKSWHVVIDLLFLYPRNWTNPPNNRFKPILEETKPKYHSSVTQVECRRLQFLFLYLVIFRFCVMSCYFLFCYYKLLQKSFYQRFFFLIVSGFSGMFRVLGFIDAHSTDMNWQTDNQQIRLGSRTWFQTSWYCRAQVEFNLINLVRHSSSTTFETGLRWS